MSSDPQSPSVPPAVDVEPALFQYLAGEGTASARHEFEAQLAGRSDQLTLVTYLQSVQFALDQDLSSVNAENALLRLRRAIDSQTRAPESEPLAPSRLRSSPMASRARWFEASRLRRATYATSATAVAVLGVLGGFFALRWNESRMAPQRPSVARTVVTGIGQQATVTLTDGVHVRLGPMTTLSVMAGTLDGRMDIHVTGKALFTVAHRTNRPLRVHTDRAVAQVLGTTFLVRQYPADTVAQLVVTEGRVSLQGFRMFGQAARQGPAYVVSERMLGTVNDSGQVKVTSKIAIDDYIGWAEGRLVFHDTPAHDVVSELGRAYGVEIRIADSSLATHPLTLTVMPAQRSLAQVLESLSAVLDLHAVQSGRLITLVPGRPASRRPVDHLPSSSEREYGK